MCIRTIVLSFIIIVLSLYSNNGCYAHGGGGGGGHGGCGHGGGGGHSCGHSGFGFHGCSFTHSCCSGHHTNFHQSYSPLFRNYYHHRHHQFYSWNNSYAYISSINAMSVLWLSPNYSYEYFIPTAIYSEPDYEFPNYYPPDLSVEPINQQVYVSKAKNDDPVNDTADGGTVYSIFLSPAEPFSPMNIRTSEFL